MPDPSPLPPPTGFWDWLNRPDNRTWFQAAVLGTLITLVGMICTYKINTVHEDVKSGKDLTKNTNEIAHATAKVETAESPKETTKAFDALKQIVANQPATQP